MKRSIIAVVAVMISLVSASSADAYLNLIYAQQACAANTRAPADGWFQANGYRPWWEYTTPGSDNSYNHSYTRYGDENIDVLVGHYSYPYGPQAEAEVVCRVTGPNSNPGVWYGYGYPRWIYLGPFSPGWSAW
jgi:hypothetical protein